MWKKLKILGIILGYAVLAVAIAAIVYWNGYYPSGSDTLCHVYKGQVLYQEILKGNWYPLYDPMWYNGVQMMRYWAPFPVYVLAACQALAGGVATDGYLVFIGLVFFCGAIVWLRIGETHNRFWLGAFMGILWFFMPNNLFAMFEEGNLPRSLCMIILPLFISYLHDYLLDGKWSSLPKLIVCFVLMAMCHLGYAGMIALAVLVFMVFFMLFYRGRKRRVLDCIGGILCAFLLTGVWTYASLQGGITSTDSSQVMKGFFQDAWISLNPFYRVENGPSTSFYYGLAALLLAVFGVCMSKKKSMSGFWTAIFIFCCTTTSMYSVLVLLPGSQYLWMLRFISIALCFTLYSLLIWNSLKKPILVLVCILLVADVIPSLSLAYGNGSGTDVASRFAEFQEDTLLTEAKEITRQRLTLLDASSLGAKGAYMVSGYENKKPGTFGAGWQSAATAHNIVQLNQAMEDGCYRYLFDRCVELGSDTVLLQVAQMQFQSEDIASADSAATESGYRLIDENDQYRLYHLDTYDNFGVISEYSAIGIGSSSAQISLFFPSVEETIETDLNKYTFEELSKYRTVYLGGFTYSDKKAAEQLVSDLSEVGVKVVILADGIPVDENTGIREFLGVECYNITFSNGYPALDTIDGVLYCDLFPDGYTKWNTVYMNGLKDVWGTLTDLDQQLDFMGTVKNDNIVMVGLNLTYHYALTQDKAVGHLLSYAIEAEHHALPKRSLVPLTVEQKQNRIEITSEYDGVNTTLAYHDIFHSEQTIWMKNYLTYINQGKTVITMKYPYLAEGLAVSAVALMCTVLLLYHSKKRLEKQSVDKVTKERG